MDNLKLVEVERVVADIWVLSDGKPGHVNQSLGLAEALVRLKPQLSFEVLPVSLKWKLLNRSEKPKLIISAGRKTHFWNVLCKFRYGAKNIVLMRPSLPYWLFDRCFVPEHDAASKKANVVNTIGPLNRMQPSEKIPGSRLALVGGTAPKHVMWDSAVVVEQLKLVQREADTPLRVATSRRTPKDILNSLSDMSNIEVMLPEDLSSQALSDLLATTEKVWVTNDSASMVYEALTAGCRVYLLKLPSIEGSRVQSGLDKLAAEGYFSSLSMDSATPKLMLNESQRHASALMEKRWF